MRLGRKVNLFRYNTKHALRQQGNSYLPLLFVTAGFPVKTHLGLRMRGGGLFER